MHLVVRDAPVVVGIGHLEHLLRARGVLGRGDGAVAIRVHRRHHGLHRGLRRRWGRGLLGKRERRQRQQAGGKHQGTAKEAFHGNSSCLGTIPRASLRRAAGAVKRPRPATGLLPFATPWPRATVSTNSCWTPPSGSCGVAPRCWTSTDATSTRWR